MDNKIKFPIYLLLLVCLMLSCSDNKEKAIELRATQNDKLTLSSSSRIVQLETKPESVLNFILKVNVDFTNDRIFVLSDFNIYIFNLNGKFLRKLNVGRGPGEITRIMSFAVNTTKKLIYAIDNSKKLCVLDYGGNMIDNYNIEDFSSCDISIQNDDNVFLLRNFVGAQEKYFVGLYNVSAQKIVRKFIAAEKSPYPMNTVITANNFVKNNGKLYFYTPNVFGLFEYRDSDFQQILSINVGKRSVPPSLSNKFEKQNRYALREEAKSRHFMPYMLYAFPFKGYYFIIADDEDLNCYALNMQDQKIYNNGVLSSYFNLPKKKSIEFPCGIQDNLIIFQGNPSDFFDPEINMDSKEIQIAGHKIEVDRDDNPFLIIVQ